MSLTTLLTEQSKTYFLLNTSTHCPPLSAFPVHRHLVVSNAVMKDFGAKTSVEMRLS
jgi:hypothetical protein